MGFAFLLCLFSFASGYSLLVTGDVNLNPSLNTSDLTYVWGTMLPILRAADVLAINHESTLAGVALSNPNVIQFEDPLNYLGTYAAAGVDFVSQANNHQFDFGLKGVATTMATLDKMNIAWGGLGSASEVMEPRVLKTQFGNLAFFTLVVDECWKNDNGTLYLDGCTCGSNAGKFVCSFSVFAFFLLFFLQALLLPINVTWLERFLEEDRVSGITLESPTI